ncbi:hypothetical protein TNCV_109561 [Trichonephila clavipes]|nr:hypothetical protein TNCV_109561 [Trichonephila clavipes]
MKQKRVGRPRFERLPNVVPVASLTDETDLVSLIRTIVREEVHRLVNQTQESFGLRSPILRRDRSRRRLKGFWPQCQQNLQKLDHDQHTPLLSLTTLETADGTSTTLALKKKYADQTLLAVLRQVPREADPQYVVTDPRRHIADPVSRQAVGARKLSKESDLPRRITVSGYQTRGDINVVLDGSKHLLFEKNIATPSMVSTYRNGKVMSGLPTCSSETKSSLEECA